MTKPTIDDTRFGETGGGVPAGTLSAPSSGRKDTGYVNGDVPPPGEHSWIWNKAHQWFKFVNSLFDGSATPNMTLPGNLTVVGELITAITDTVTMKSSNDVILNGGRIAYNSGAPANVVVSAALAQVSIPGGGDTGPTREHDRINFIKAATGATNGKAYYHFSLLAGQHLQSWSVDLIKGTNSGATITAKLLYNTSTLTITQVGTTQTNTTNAPGTTTIGEASLNHVVLALKDYYVEVGSPSSGAGSGTDQAFALALTFT